MNKGVVLMRLMMFTVMVSAMSAMMFNIVLPTIGEEFDLSIAQVSWLTSAYSLIYAIGTVTYGKLSDRFQLKNLLTFGLTLFAAGSLIGLVSQSFWMALLGRCLQSAGASAVPATALIIPVRYFPPEKRGSALSMTAVGVALGGALAPVVSGIIVSFLNWRWLFLPSLLILLLLPLFRKFMEFEEKAQERKPFDWLGGGLLAATTTSLLLGVTNRSLWFFAVGIIALILFVVRIRSIEYGFVQPKVFRNSQYTTALSLLLLISGTGVSIYFLTPVWLSKVYHLESNLIGFVMVPAAVAAATLGRIGGKLADRRGNQFLFAIASSSLMLCFAALSILIGIPPMWIALVLIFGNVGMTFMQIAMSNTVSRSLPKDQVGVGMGLFSMINFISNGMGMGVYGFVAAQGTSSPWNPLLVDRSGGLFSNIYLVLVGVHILILMVFMMQFRASRTNLAPEGART